MWFPHLLFLLIVYTFGPGLLLVRPLRLAPRERLVVAIGLGLFLNYVLGFGLFVADLTFIADIPGHIAIAFLSMVLALAAWKDWLQLLRCRQVRQLLIIWGLLFVWGMVLLSMVRNFGGGTWGGDWVEHYQRFSFFFGGGDYAFKFIGQYPLPMRPPMMNVLTASLLSQAAPMEQMMEGYQVVFVFLNSLVFLPLAILVPRLIRLSPRVVRKTPWTLAALLAASPMFAQNLTYTWTKLFAAYYAIAAIAVYLTAFRRQRMKDEVGGMKEEVASPASSFTLHPSSLLFPLAFALLCIGFLVHFSVGPYGLFLGLHYVAAVWWRRPNKFREAATIAAVSLLVFAAWFPWSIRHYGVTTTFTSTSAVSDSVKMTPTENVGNIVKNIRNTLVPTIVQKPGLIWAADVSQRDPDLDQPSFAGKLRDSAFLIYQVSLPGGLGSAGCVVAVLLIVRALAGKDPTVRPVRRFWLAFIPIVFFAGVAVYGGVDRFGVAHICLQPMVLIGVALVAGGVWRISLRLRGVLLVGLLLDFSIGVMLQMTLQHQIPQIQVVQVPGPAGTPIVAYDVIEAPDNPSRAAQNNAGDRLRLSVDSPRDFWGDRFRDGGLPTLQFLAGAMMAFLLFKGLTAPRSPQVVPVPDAPPPTRIKKRKK
ncbi:hypothetical protein [Humisphaera borealis]|uniref:Uncharacterized protein n=1 Tax=Humisphaera borealis TaxID=2807512 RepID=A0A7M2WX79_9BACT|nr:hypothetical protein [Humisphaera borealis]QOV89954.1 hypothetical protein IPV69_00855 [Humisphaera borealis]